MIPGCSRGQIESLPMDPQMHFCSLTQERNMSLLPTISVQGRCIKLQGSSSQKTPLNLKLAGSHFEQ